MEGRAIARPNPRSPHRHRRRCSPLQWRAEQLPGQTLRARPAGAADLGPSMEGRAIARPNCTRTSEMAVFSDDLQWRAEQLPGQTDPADMDRVDDIPLQWRAEQLPGQTRRHSSGFPHSPSPFNGGPSNCPAKRHGVPERACARDPPSMEGRAIARPNVDRHVVTARGNAAPSMEGRAIARPNSVMVMRISRHRNGPSMEGRAIARPNLHEAVAGFGDVEPLQWRAEQLPGQTSGSRRTAGCRCPPFNGGPSNCPAKQAFGVTGSPAARSLQWRAEQLPGQTGFGLGVEVGAPPPSMEGRAIARPNSPARRRSRPRHKSFNGGPSNCPAKQRPRAQPRLGVALLQWRAEQLPGQTMASSPW